MTLKSSLIEALGNKGTNPQFTQAKVEQVVVNGSGVSMNRPSSHPRPNNEASKPLDPQANKDLIHAPVQ